MLLDLAIPERSETISLKNCISDLSKETFFPKSVKNHLKLLYKLTKNQIILIIKQMFVNNNSDDKATIFGCH
jgi:hypothetical protein